VVIFVKEGWFPAKIELTYKKWSKNQAKNEDMMRKEWEGYSVADIVDILMREHGIVEVPSGLDGGTAAALMMLDGVTMDPTEEAISFLTDIGLLGVEEAWTLSLRHLEEKFTYSFAA
jgi:hypothetical protein